MKRNLRILFFLVYTHLLLQTTGNAQISLGKPTPHPSAILDISDSTKGILIPRMTTVQRNAIKSPANGLIVFNINTNQLNFYKDSTWSEFNSSAAYTAPSVVRELKVTSELGERKRTATAVVSYKEPTNNGGAVLLAYKVWYKQSNETVFKKYQLATSLECKVPDLSLGEKYDFTVEAINAGSLASDTVTVTGVKMITYITDAAMDLQVSAELSGSVPRITSNTTFSYTAPDFTGGAKIDGYAILLRRTGSSTWSVVASKNTATKFDIDTLQLGVKYDFGVSVLNEAGNSDTSVTSYIMPVTKADKPSIDSLVPSLYKDIPNTLAAVKLYWKAPVYTGGSDITGYKLSWRKKEKESTTLSFWKEEILQKTDNSYLLNDLSVGTTYEFTLQTINGLDENNSGRLSDTAYAFVTTAETESDKPSIVSLESKTTGEVPEVSALFALKYTAPTYTGGSAISKYELEYKHKDSSSWQQGTGVYESINAGSFTWIEERLLPGSKYEIRLYAVNGTGKRSKADTISATMPTTVSDRAMWVSGKADTTGAIPETTAKATLKWQSPVYTGGTKINKYLVKYRNTTAKTAWSSETEYADTVSAAEITDLSVGDIYQFSIRVANDAGESDTSMLELTMPVTVPAAPAQLTLSAAISGEVPTADATITTNWLAPIYTGGSKIDGYNIYTSTDSTDFKLITKDFTNKQLFINGLLLGKKYYIHVTATNVAGESAPAAMSITTGTTKPGVPGSVKVEYTLTGSIPAVLAKATVSVEYPAYDGGDSVLGYSVKYMPQSDNKDQSAWINKDTRGTKIATTNKFEIDSLQVGVTYDFVVAAFNNTGSSTDVVLSKRAPVTAPDTAIITNVSVGESSVYDRMAKATISIKNPFYTGGSAISSYWVSDTAGKRTVISGTSPVAVDSLNLGQLYNFGVQVQNADDSLSAMVYTGNYRMPVIAPSVPVIDSVPSAVSSSISQRAVAAVHFKESTFNGGAPINRYTVRIMPGNIIRHGVKSPLIVDSLVLGRLYQFSLRAENDSAKTSAYTEIWPAQMVIAPATAPTGIKLVGSVQQSNSRTGGATVSFSEPTANGGSNITSYALDYSADSGKTWQGYTSNASGTSIVVNGLAIGNDSVSNVAWKFRVRAINAAGASEWAESDSAVQLFAAPDAPAAAQLSVAGTNVTVRFTAPLFKGGSNIKDYEVKVYDGSTGNLLMNLEGNVSSPVVFSTAGANNPLVNATNIFVRVTAINNVGGRSTSSPESNKIYIKPVVPAAPTEITVKAATGSGEDYKEGRLLVEFNAPVDTGSAAITKYDIQYSNNSGSNWTTSSDTVIVSSEGISSTITKLSIGNTTASNAPYLVRVRAVNAAGNSPWLQLQQAVYIYGKPEAPSITQSAIEPGKINFSYTYPNSYFGGADIKKLMFLLYDNANDKLLDSIANPAADANGVYTYTLDQTKPVFSGVTAVNFKLLATNAADSTALSSASSTLTLFTAPAQVTSATITPSVSTTESRKGYIKYMFKEPTSSAGSAPMKQYIVRYGYISDQNQITIVGYDTIAATQPGDDKMGQTPLLDVGTDDSVNPEYTVEVLSENTASLVSAWKSAGIVKVFALPDPASINTNTAFQTVETKKLDIYYTLPTYKGGSKISTTGYVAVYNAADTTKKLAEFSNVDLTSAAITVDVDPNSDTYSSADAIVVRLFIKNDLNIWVPSATSRSITLVKKPGTITSPITGRVWMDRNLGASRVATSATDDQAYGDLYQWGRAADGHQKRTSIVTNIQRTSLTEGHADFVLNGVDWKSGSWSSVSIMSNLWQQGSQANNPCPSGFRVPTLQEISNELSLSIGATNNLINNLKFTFAKYRDNKSGSLANTSKGYYWTSDYLSSGQSPKFFELAEGTYTTYDGSNALGISVRCIQELSQN